MAAYLIGEIRVKDPAQWRVYVDGVRHTLAPYRAEVVFRGERGAVLAGEQPRELAVVIRFADLETLQEWFDSPAYQALIPTRDRAADVVITAYTATA